MCAIAISVFSYSFQIAGAAILLLWSIGNCDKKIKRMCFEEHGGILMGTIDEKGAHFTIDKASLRKNAKTLYLNIAAFADLVIGYALTILMQAVDLTPQCMLVSVAVVTLLLLLAEYGLAALAARIKYRKDFDFTEDEAGDMIPVNTTLIEVVGEENEHTAAN